MTSENVRVKYVQYNNILYVHTVNTPRLAQWQNTHMKPIKQEKFCMIFWTVGVFLKI